MAFRFYTLWKQRFCTLSLCIDIKISDWFEALVTLGCNYFVWGPQVVSLQASRFASNHIGKTTEISHAQRVMKDILPRSLWKRIKRTLKVTYLIREGFRVMDGVSVIILILNASTSLWFVSVTFRRLRFPGTDPAIYCFGSGDLAGGGQREKMCKLMGLRKEQQYVTAAEAREPSKWSQASAAEQAPALHVLVCYGFRWALPTAYFNKSECCLCSG